MSKSNAMRKARKKLRKNNSQPAVMQKSHQPQLRVQQPTTKGCCGGGR